MDFIYELMNTLISFDFISYSFMKNALLAIIISAPIFALLGTMIVNKKMAFFSDAMGHSALCGIAVGVLFGFTNHSLSMIFFAIFFSVLLNFVKDRTSYGTDTIISVFTSIALALGLTLLSFSGSFNKYNSYLVGDILSITKQEIIYLFVCFILVILLWIFSYNKINAESINRSLSKSKGINGKLYDYIFSAFVSVVIMLSIRWIGVLLINSLVILPAAAARNISSNTRQYHIWTVLFSMVMGISGLIMSYYIHVPTGPMIVLLLGGTFFITFMIHSFAKR
jgi:zinc transport system permease protein